MRWNFRPFYSQLLVSIVFSLSVHCEKGEEPHETPVNFEKARSDQGSSLRASLDPSVPDPGVAGFDLEGERALKASEGQSPTPSVSSIRWEEVWREPRIPLERLPSNLGVLRAAQLPVLLPSDPVLLKAAQLTGGENWYAASIALDGYDVFVTGTCIVFTLPEGTVGPAPRASANDVTRVEFSPQVSFEAHGAAYSVSVECDRADSDPRCVEDATILALAKSLRVAAVSAL